MGFGWIARLELVVQQVDLARKPGGGGGGAGSGGGVMPESGKGVQKEAVTRWTPKSFIGGCAGRPSLHSLFVGAAS